MFKVHDKISRDFKNCIGKHDCRKGLNLTLVSSYFIFVFREKIGNKIKVICYQLIHFPRYMFLPEVLI